VLETCRGMKWTYRETKILFIKLVNHWDKSEGYFSTYKVHSRNLINKTCISKCALHIYNSKCESRNTSHNSKHSHSEYVIYILLTLSVTYLFSFHATYWIHKSYTAMCQQFWSKDQYLFKETCSQLHFQISETRYM
jgi:hypothetical protein